MLICQYLNIIYHIICRQTFEYQAELYSALDVCFVIVSWPSLGYFNPLEHQYYTLDK